MSYLIAALAATVLLLILAIQNPGLVEVRFLFWQGSLPMALLLLVSTVVGGALAIGGAMPQRLREIKLLRELQAKVQSTVDELTIPAVDAAGAAPTVEGLAEAAQGLQERQQ